MKTYILNDDGAPELCEDYLAWSEWMSKNHAKRRIGYTIGSIKQKEEILGNVTVSTVFLGLDHSFGQSSAPLLYETMIFGGGDLHQTTERYSTKEQALAGHWRAVGKLEGKFNRS